jgi:hypothetical protein
MICETWHARVRVSFGGARRCASSTAACAGTARAMLMTAATVVLP